MLWLTIQFAFKAPAFAAEGGIAGVGQRILLAFIDPFGTIWFIYLLPIFFVVARLTRRVPWLDRSGSIGAALEMAHITDRLE